jgi:excisionase family DNA binding protein
MTQLTSKNQLPNYLTPAQVSEHLNISKSLVYKLITEQKFKTVKIASTTRIPYTELQRFVERQTIAADFQSAVH